MSGLNYIKLKFSPTVSTYGKKIFLVMVSEVSPVMAVVAYSDVCSHLGGSERRELR